MTTSLLQAKAAVPEYDRSKLVARIAHIGFGAFHRAHQAVCADKLPLSSAAIVVIAKST